MTSLTEEWERSAASRLAVMLRYLDRQYPRRIGGVCPLYLHTSEWFMPGPDDVGSGWAGDNSVPSPSPCRQNVHETRMGLRAPSSSGSSRVGTR